MQRSENNLRYHLPSCSRPGHFAVSGYAPQINQAEGSYSLTDRRVQMSHCRGIDFPVESRPKLRHACTSSLLLATEGGLWSQNVTVCSAVLPQRCLRASALRLRPATLCCIVCRHLCECGLLSSRINTRACVRLMDQLILAKRNCHQFFRELIMFSSHLECMKDPPWHPRQHLIPSLGFPGSGVYCIAIYLFGGGIHLIVCT